VDEPPVAEVADTEAVAEPADVEVADAPAEVADAPAEVADAPAEVAVGAVEPVESPVGDEEVESEPAGRHARASMFSRFRRRGPAPTEAGTPDDDPETAGAAAPEAVVEPDEVAEPEASAAAGATAEVGPAPEAMPVPVPEVAPEPVVAEAPVEAEPAPQPSVARQFAEVRPEPEPEPEPEPAPAVPAVFAAAVDILPGNAATGGRFGRHRAPLPRRVPAPAGEPVPAAAPAVPAEPRPEAAVPVTVADPATPPAQTATDVGARPASPLAHPAISELRGLYEPAVAPRHASAPASESTAPNGLTRRTPKAPAPEPVPVPAGPRRERTASEVRGMLAGFRAGVERGRTTDTTEPTDPTER
jgi:hypothetical protein